MTLRGAPGDEVLIRLRMSAHDAHYGGNLVDGARILGLFGDVATELLVRIDGDEGLFRAYENVEFLASTDAWFRPVNFYIGPDGALYVMDFYRLVIEHPEWMATDAANSKDLTTGIDRGRIYRIVPDGTPAPKPVRFRRPIPPSMA